MNRRIVLLISAMTFLVFSIVYDNFYMTAMLTGTYIYDFPSSVAEGPSQGAYLIVKKNGEFESDTWGNGRYTISGSRLRLTYNYEFGRTGFECGIYRRFFWGEPRLSVVRDLNYYFAKKD